MGIIIKIPEYFYGFPRPVKQALGVRDITKERIKRIILAID
jgi:hypothetical protein